MRQTKREELVEKATAIFYRNGFQATGMDRLVTETGISKTSIYKHFKTKDDLIVAALKSRDAFLRGWLFGRMAQLASTPREQLIAMFDALHEWFNEPDFHGCMFAKASSEYQDPEHPINREATDHVARISAQLAEIAEEAGLNQPTELARQLALLKEGAVVLATMGRGGTPALDAKAVAIKLVDEATPDK
ncbi:MAG: TetR/AcrR family transcriptional regulator [Alphaproteobacteria bacterium]|nr:TetR/AcrR family transcriptional regulator [Alphaproteobacteria bacterium]